MARKKSSLRHFVSQIKKEYEVHASVGYLPYEDLKKALDIFSDSEPAILYLNITSGYIAVVKKPRERLKVFLDLGTSDEKYVSSLIKKFGYRQIGQEEFNREVFEICS
jgi:hypothetical protein